MADNTWLRTLPQLALTTLALSLTSLQITAASPPPSPPDRSDGYTMTLLADGKWLVAGGHKASGSSSDADRVDLYDPSTRSWRKTCKLIGQRLYHTATLLSNGNVLVAGGMSVSDATYLASAEVYDPASEKWTTTGPMNQARAGHTLTLLANGSVLAAGGVTNFVRGLLSTAEVFDPSTGTWTLTAPMNTTRVGHTAAPLTNGLVLVACGLDEQSNYRPSAELYDPAQRKWTMTGSVKDWIHWSYTATVLTNGLVLLTTSDTNAWVASQELYDPATGQWKAIGPRRPHFVSSRDTQPTLTILPQTGTSFLASEEIQLLVETSDHLGVTNISLFRDNLKVAESEEDPLRYNLTNAAAGTYVFIAQAAYANGLAATSSPVSLIVSAPGPQVSVTPLPSERRASPYFHSSPATLMASVVGVSPGALTNLTLNGVPQPLKTGDFALHAPLAEGENTFVLTATDNQGKTASATNVVFLESRLPTISITSPTNNASLDVMRVDVQGTFSEMSLRQITVNGRPTFTRNNTFEALNVFLRPGTNEISAVVENLAGSMTTNSVVIRGPTGTNAFGIDPVQLIADPIGGFAPLQVALKIKAKVPGEIKRVFYDFDGDHVTDRTETDLRPVSVTFAEPGERFPIATVETTAGRFSSLGQGFWFIEGTRITVQAPPVQLAAINVPDPVDLKCVATNRLYVLSDRTATLTEFDTNGQPIRLRKNLGGKPTGFDVDEAGNVYVALSASNQVWKLKPTTGSFEPDVTFGNGGIIGNKDGSSGSKSNELNAPFSVAVTRDFGGGAIMVSDSGNHRIQRFAEDGRFDNRGAVHVNKDGEFVSTFGEQGTNQGQLRSPKGICLGRSHGYLLIADSGNDRIVAAHPEFGPEAASGETGTALGQFREPINLCESDRGLCVADVGNDRIQIFDPVNGGGERGPLAPFKPRVAISKELGLKHPNAVAWVEDFLEEKLYIADTGNDRVLLVKFPTDNPEAVWEAMKRHLLKGDINGAVSYFASSESEKYRESYLAIGTNDLFKIISEIPAIAPISIEREKAQYYFQQKVDGVLLTFPIEFVRENGRWKIEEY